MESQETWDVQEASRALGLDAASGRRLTPRTAERLQGSRGGTMYSGWLLKVRGGGREMLGDARGLLCPATGRSPPGAPEGGLTAG